MDLIYCAGSNKRLTQIAYEAGLLLGMRSDKIAYDFPISFIDIDYKAPDFSAHLNKVKKYQPKYAVVPDLSERAVSEADVERAVNQAKLLGDYCEVPLVVPKLSGQLPLISTRWTIAYSIPTRYGGAKFGVWKLVGRRVHLLGGSPHEQMKLYRYLPEWIQSADGNMAMKMATQFAKYWQGHKWLQHPGAHRRQKDLYLECWRWSCENIYRHWHYLAEPITL